MNKMNVKIYFRRAVVASVVLLVLFLIYSVVVLKKRVEAHERVIIENQIYISDTALKIETFMQMMSQEFEDEVMHVIRKERREREKIEKEKEIEQ